MLLALVGPVNGEEKEARRLLGKLILASRGEQKLVVEELYDHGDTIIKDVIEGWRIGEISVVEVEGVQTPLLKRGEGDYVVVMTGKTFSGGDGGTINRASRGLRKKLRNVVDFLDLSSADSNERIEAAMKLGLSQKGDYVEVLEERVGRQKDPSVREAFEVALNIALLKNGDETQKLESVKELGETASFPARDFIEALRTEAEEIGGDGSSDLIRACVVALEKIDKMQKRV